MKNECSVNPRYSIWANALLSDGKILFWYTGRDKSKSKLDFYKDFYYSRIKVDEYEKIHKLTLVQKEFLVFKDEDNNRIFDFDAVDFYKQYEISPDSKGQPPYRSERLVSPKSIGGYLAKRTNDYICCPYCGEQICRPWERLVYKPQFCRICLKPIDWNRIAKGV